MDASSSLGPFTGTWNLIPESCNYEQGIPPVSATHTFTSTGTPNQLHFVVHWKEVDGKENHSEYDVLVDELSH